jgi:hypothetical protein
MDTLIMSALIVFVIGAFAFLSVVFVEITVALAQRWRLSGLINPARRQ